MDHHRRRGRQPSASTKVERKIIERNRRNHMKDLHSKLHSLLPNYNPREVLPLPDQVDEAIKYIKSLEGNVKEANEKKQRLLSSKRARSSSGTKLGTVVKSPEIVQIHEMGSSLEVVLTCGLGNQFIFNEIIRILHEDNVEVLRVNSSQIPGEQDLMLHVLHAQIPPSLTQLSGAAKVSERLKSFVNESINDVETTQPDFFSGFGTSNEIMWNYLPDNL